MNGLDRVSIINGQSLVEEKVPSEQFFISDFRAPRLFFFFFKRKWGRNGKKILEHPFGRDDGSRNPFWSWYSEMES